MLTQLVIKNFGLIDEVSIEPGEGLNVLTGETGAGKTILIDALRFTLGERLNSSQIRDASRPCTVEAVFELSDKYLAEYPVFSEHTSSDDSRLIINRTAAPDGRSRIKVNGLNLAVSELKNLGNHLVDFHGPNDHQLLLSSDSHITTLDRLSDLGSLKKEYSEIYGEYSALLRRQKDLDELAASRERDLDLLTHQIKELEQVPLDEQKYEDLKHEQARLDNAEKLHESVQALIQILEDEEYGLTETVRKSFTPMGELNRMDESTRDFAELLDRIQSSADVLLSSLRAYADNLTFEPDTAGQVQKKNDIYYDIIRKYGPSLSDAKKFYEEARRKYDLLVDLEHNDAELKKKTREAEKAATLLASKITKARKKTAALLKDTIESELKELGIKHVLFECRIEKAELGPDGRDKVTFYISPNAGEDLKPLAEIVSSGEAARLMLALKKALTRVDPIPVLIFDEIDSSIGGRLGTITGKKLKSISTDRQVILITHLPQIASFGNVHFKVIKRVEKGRTLTDVRPLEGDDRVKELAEMMSGEGKSDLSVKHARDMLAGAA